jgi:ketosteroid isomerase-like protein
VGTPGPPTPCEAAARQSGSNPASSTSYLLAYVSYGRNIAERLPSEFLDRFKEHFDCWNRGELDRMLDIYAEDAVFDVSAVFTDVEPMRGSKDILRYWETLRETWDGLRIDPLEGFDLGDGRFVLDQRVWAKGTRSGIGVDQRFAMLYAIRPDDKLIIHAQLLPDVETAISVAESSAS